MKIYTPEEFAKILKKHEMGFQDEAGGERADLRGANLYGAYLNGANLCGANLSGANLGQANLCGANLCRANLYGANLCGAYLCGANLEQANLERANLERATTDYPIYQVYLGQYHVFTEKQYVTIRCSRKLVSEWLQVTKQEAEKLGLHPSCYQDYMDFIKWYSRKDVAKLP